MLVLIGIVLMLGIGGAISLTRKKTPEVIAPPVEEMLYPQEKILGMSVQGREITAYSYGEGEDHLVFVGGIHGGYEWNGVLLAYEFMDHIGAAPDTIPENIKITVIPSLNPDAVFKVTSKEGRFVTTDVSKNENLLASARFNANNVDLNRNFDCKWQPTSMWRSKEVSAGTAPHSEPEVKALVDFVLSEKPSMVLFWHSQASAVYASFCEGEISPTTDVLYKAYARASGYKAEEAFTGYVITGDAGDWLAKIGVPAISVELTDHEATEFSRNLKGIEALFEYFQK